MYSPPRTAGEYRAWWEASTNVPYGYCRCGCEEKTKRCKTHVPSRGYVAGTPAKFLPGHGNKKSHAERTANLASPNPSGLCMCGCGRPTPIAKQTKRMSGWVKGEPIPFLPQHHNNLKKLPNESDLCADYLSGDTPRTLSERYEVSTSSIFRILKRNGVDRKRKPVRVEEIIKGYAAGEIISEMADRLGCNFATIHHVLRREGIEPNRHPEGRFGYDCNYTFFDEINSEAKAYWLGFIAADGCVSDGGRLTICLSERDANHLELFKQDIGATHPIKIRDRKAIIHIGSVKLCSGLIKHGVTPRKTFTLKWPHHLPPETQRHFLRGYSDGDGCFYNGRSSHVRKDGTRQRILQWNAIGNDGFTVDLQDLLIRSIGVNRTKRCRASRSHEDIRVVRYGSNSASRVAAFMYDAATIYLPRKHQIASLYNYRDRSSNCTHSSKSVSPSLKPPVVTSVLPSA